MPTIPISTTLDAIHKRDLITNVRLSKVERDLLTRAAMQMGLPMSVYIRVVAILAARQTLG